MKNQKKVMALILSVAVMSTSVTPVSAAKYSGSTHVGGAEGSIITYSIEVGANRNIYFPLNFVEHDKGKKDGVFTAELEKGDEFGVEASLTYDMDAYFAGIEVSAGVSSSVTQGRRKTYEHTAIGKSKKSGYYIIEGTVPGKSGITTTMQVRSCKTGKLTANKKNSYGFTPKVGAIIGFHTRDGVEWPEQIYKDSLPYVIVCKAMGIS